VTSPGQSSISACNGATTTSFGVQQTSQLAALESPGGTVSPCDQYASMNERHAAATLRDNGDLYRRSVVLSIDWVTLWRSGLASRLST